MSRLRRELVQEEDAGVLFFDEVLLFQLTTIEKMMIHYQTGETHWQ